MSLFLVASGVDKALDRLAKSSTEASFTVYSEHGKALFAYSGDLKECKALAKPVPLTTPLFLHRT